MPVDIILLVVLAALLVFMFWNSRKRMQKAKAEQEQKRRQTVPGAKVLLQGGLYGTIVSYDPEDLDTPAQVELAPGTIVEVHSQAVLRVVDTDADAVTEDEFIEAEASEQEYIADRAAGLVHDDVPEIEKIRTEADGDDKDKPSA